MRSWPDFLDALTAPLESLVVSEKQIEVPAIVDRWNLPAEDRGALRQWGLPSELPARLRLQAEPDPMLVPNVASDEERRLVSPKDRLYDLGWWGPNDHTPKVGAVAENGRVLGIRPRPLDIEDIHRDLRVHNVGFHRPAVSFINSTVARYVEIAWRWDAAVGVLQRMPDAVDVEEVEVEKSNRRRFLKGLALIDPALDDEALDSLWISAVLEN